MTNAREITCKSCGNKYLPFVDGIWRQDEFYCSAECLYVPFFQLLLGGPLRMLEKLRPIDSSPPRDQRETDEPKPDNETQRGGH